MVSENQNRNLSTAEISDILSVLPHRYPFLLIDKIIDIDGDDSAIGIKNVSFNEPHFLGHFPNSPIMPGVLIIEAMAQTAGAISLLNNFGDNKDKPGIVYFMTIDNAKFRKPVLPGDQLHLHVKKLRSRLGISKYACVAKVDDYIVAEAEVSARIGVDL